MGNQALQSYSLSSGLSVAAKGSASGGPDLLWKIFEAKSKSGPSQEVSLWVIDKKTISKDDPAQRDFIFDLLRKDAQSLLRLRHPSIIRISKPLQEDGNTFALETEAVFASLANILKDLRNVDQVSAALENSTLEPLEIKMGLMQLCEAIQFLHQNANLVHGNICPDNIYLTKEGKWKLGGFSYSQAPMKGSEKEVSFRPFYRSIPLDFVAPERIQGRVEPAGDVYSLGAVMYRLILGAVYKPTLGGFPSSVLNQLPSGLPLQEMLSTSPYQRPTITALSEAPYFNDVLTRTLTYVEHLLEKDDQSKAEFFRKFLSAINQFSKKILREKILPIMLTELRNTIMVPLILPNVFAIAQKFEDKTTFQTEIFPALAKLMMVEEPFQIPLIFLQHLEFMITHLEPHAIQSYIMPFVFLAFGHPRLEVQVGALAVAPSFAPLVTYDQLKHSILPRIEALCLQVNNERIRIKALECYSKFVPLFTPAVVHESIFPVLVKVSHMSSTPAVKMALVGVCDSISEKAGVDVSAKLIMPFILPMLADKDMTSKQFGVVLSITKKIFQSIEEGRFRDYSNLPTSSAELAARSPAPEVKEKDSDWDDVFVKITKPISNAVSSVVSAAATVSPAVAKLTESKSNSNATSNTSTNTKTNTATNTGISPQKSPEPEKVSIDILNFPGRPPLKDSASNAPIPQGEKDPFASLTSTAMASNPSLKQSNPPSPSSPALSTATSNTTLPSQTSKPVSVLTHSTLSANPPSPFITPSPNPTLSSSNLATASNPLPQSKSLSTTIPLGQSSPFAISTLGSNNPNPQSQFTPSFNSNPPSASPFDPFGTQQPRPAPMNFSNPQNALTPNLIATSSTQSPFVIPQSAPSYGFQSQPQPSGFSNPSQTSSVSFSARSGSLI